MSTQILSASFTNPNGNLTPCCPQSPALYYDDPGMTTLWGWSVQTRKWVLLPTVPQVVFQGTGTPTSAPANTLLPAVYVDLLTKNLFVWNVTTQLWQ